MFIVDALFNKLSSGLSGYRVDILEKMKSDKSNIIIHNIQVILYKVQAF